MKWKDISGPLPAFEAQARGSIRVRLNKTIYPGKWHVGMFFCFGGESLDAPIKMISADDEAAAKRRAAELVKKHRRDLLMALVELEAP